MSSINSGLFNYLNLPDFITVNNCYENIKYEYENNYICFHDNDILSFLVEKEVVQKKNHFFPSDH